MMERSRIPGDHLAPLGRPERVADGEGGERVAVIHGQAAAASCSCSCCRDPNGPPRQSVSVRVASEHVRRDASVRRFHVQKLASQNQGTPRSLPSLPRRGKCPRTMGRSVRTPELVQHHYSQVSFWIFHRVSTTHTSRHIGLCFLCPIGVQFWCSFCFVVREEEPLFMCAIWI